MSAITFLTMKQRLASMLRMDQTRADQNTLLGFWLNQSQQEIWGAHDWPWTLDREIVQMVIDKTAGTVSINSGATSVTGSGTAFAAGDVGKYIQFSSSNDWYRISAQSSATALTIESAYTGASDLSGGTYKIRQIFYSLSSSVERVMSVRQTISPSKLEMIHYRNFDLKRPHPTATGSPNTLILFGYDSNNNWRFTPYPWPDVVENLEVRLKKKATDLSADGDISNIPEQFHQTVLMDGGLYRGLEYVRSGDGDRRAEVKKNDFKDGLEKMIANYAGPSDQDHVIENKDERVSIENIVPFPAGWS